MGLLLGAKPIPEIDRTRDFQKIEPDTAFTVELPSGERRTFIIEGNGPIGILEEEIDVANPIAQRAVGLTCGESVVLLENPYRKEAGTIVEIKHKYLYLLHKSMANYEYLFPTEQQFFSVPLKVEPEGEADLQPILDMVSRRQDSIIRIENIYQNNPIPIPIVAKALNLHPIDAWFGLQGGRVKIAYCHGTPQERIKANQQLENIEAGIILDPITLFTLFSLEVLKQVTAYSGKKIGITQSTIDLFANLVASRKEMDDHLTLGKEGDTFVRTEYSKTEIEKSIEPFTNLLSWCRGNCDIVPAVGKRVLSKDDEVILDGLGQAFVDTLRAAESSGRLLISDDLNFRQYAKLVFEIEGVWSQPLLDMVHHCGHIDRTTYIESMLKISRMNYSFVSFTVADLRHALDVDIACGTSFFPEVLSSMGRQEVDVFSVFSVASRFLVVLWQAHLSHSQKRKATFATLEAIVRHPAFAAEDMVLYTFACILRLAIIDKLLSNRLFQECRISFRDWCEGHFMPVRTLWEGRRNNSKI